MKAEAAAAGPPTGDGRSGGDASLKEQGNRFFKSGNYLKAAALYTQAIKLDPRSAALYSNRSAAFLHLFKLNKALADAEMTISLNPEWEKGYFRKGCILEAMERYDEAISTFEVALQYNSQSTEISKRIKKLSQLVKDKQRAIEVENMRSDIDISKLLSPVKPELSLKFATEEGANGMFSFIVEILDKAIKAWHESGKLDQRVHFLLDREKTDTEKYAPAVNVDKAFESPDTHRECFSFLRKYAEESFSKAACLVASKSNISYPQVWRGQGSRKWKHGNTDGFFFQFESPVLRKLWFVPSCSEKGKKLCRDPEALDVSAHEVLPRLFKENVSNHQ